MHLGTRDRTIRPNPESLERNVADAIEVVVKFSDDSLAIASAGRLDLPGPGGALLGAILAAHPEFSFRSSIEGGDEWLTALRFCAAFHTHKDHADPTSYFSAPILENNRARAVSLVRAFLSHPSVETAWLRGPALTPAVDLLPPTPNFGGQQYHLDAAPNGINIRNAWNLYYGSSGINLRYADVEYAWTFDHEDYPIVTDSRTLFSNVPPGHGTAVVGVMSAAQNGYGVDGGVPDAQAYAADNFNGMAALRGSILRSGDAVIIELAWASDPKGACVLPPNQPNVPMERDDAIFTQIQLLTANGVVFYEPAGNAGHDLDAACWGGELSRNGRDSGAIMVGATNVHVPGLPEGSCGVGATNQLTAAFFSNFGSRIDANGWGWCVTTTGHTGNLFAPNGDLRQYYSESFNGTSSATPIVSTAGMAIQGWQKARTGRMYSSRITRSILQHFGTATTGPHFIAKQPDVGATLGWLAADDDGDGVVNGDELSAGRLANISTRGQVGTNNERMIAGFVVQGGSTKTVALVGTGPSLANFGIQNPLTNPKLTVVNQNQQVIATNDDWQSGPDAAQLQVMGYAPSNAFESAVLVALSPGAYTATLEGVGGGTGVGLIAAYEVDASHSDLPLFGNISTRGLVVDANNPMIAGFQVHGDYPRRVAIVATGPSLVPYGLNGLQNPSLIVVRSSDQSVIASNDDWVNPPSNQSIMLATPFAPTVSTEAALVITLNPGLYTVIVSPSPGTSGNGIAVVAVYAY